DRQRLTDVIVNSTGELRRSWLLRHPLVGAIAIQKALGGCRAEPPASWCYGGGSQQVQEFASSPEAMTRTVSELGAFFAVAEGGCATPTTTTTLPRSRCTCPDGSACDPATQGACGSCSGIGGLCYVGAQASCHSDGDCG